VRNGSASLVQATSHLTSNFFFSGSPFAIDTDDGTSWLNASSNVVYKQPLFKVDYGGHSKMYTGNVVLFSSCGMHSNIAPRDPNGPEHCHFFSPCADKDPDNVFSFNKCVGATSLLRCGTCRPGVDCARIENNTYYSPAGNGSEVCRNGTVEAGSRTFPIPDDAALLAMARRALGMA